MGRVLYWGEPGSGKTLRLCMHAVQQMYYDVRGGVYDSYDLVDEFISMGYRFTKSYEHTVFTNFDVNSDGTKIPNLRSYIVNPYRVGLYIKDYYTDNFPPGTNFIWTELQNYFPAELWDYLRPEIKRYWQTSRHNNISLTADCQRPMDIAKPIRELFDTFIEVISVEHIVIDGRVVAHEWTLREIKGNRTLEEYLRTNNKNLCREYKETSDKCYFYNYDSYFCRDLHVKGREKQNFKVEHFRGNEDLFSMPDGYLIKKGDRVKKDNMGVEYY